MHPDSLLALYKSPYLATT